MFTRCLSCISRLSVRNKWLKPPKIKPWVPPVLCYHRYDTLAKWHYDIVCNDTTWRRTDKSPLWWLTYSGMGLWFLVVVFHFVLCVLCACFFDGVVPFTFLDLCFSFSLVFSRSFSSASFLSHSDFQCFC